MNKLGGGPHSNPFLIGMIYFNLAMELALLMGNYTCKSYISSCSTECMNDFVKVMYEETTSESTISCVFLNQSDNSEKSCCITYGLCESLTSQERPENAQTDCSKDSLYNIELELSGSSSQTYCYIVIASNVTHIVKVEGNFTTGINISMYIQNLYLPLYDIKVSVIIISRYHSTSSPGIHIRGQISTAALASAIIIPCICIILLIILMGIVVITVIKRRKSRQSKGTEG